MSDKKGLNPFNKFLLDSGIKFSKNLYNNLRPYNLKNLYNSKYEKWVYLSSIPLTGTYLITKTDLSLICDLVLATTNYFIFKSIYQTNLQSFYLIRYRHVSNLFNKNAAVVSVTKDKTTKDITYTLNSYVTIKEIFSSKDKLEQYFNTNVLEIEQHKYNKRLVKIVTDKVNNLENSKDIVNKLMNILRYYNFMPKLVKSEELDFYTMVEVSILADIKQVTNKVDDISFKLKKQVNIELENNFIFKINKKDIPIFDFEEYLHKTKKNSKNFLQVLLGINHKTGKIVTADLTSILHTFINGLTGSGKSCIFNSIIQSLIYWTSNNISLIMVDFKLIEFRQYKDFKNVTYITDLDIFNKVLDNIINIMDKRYKTFEDCKNIEDYNYKRQVKMPYLIVCIDECSFISTHDKSKYIWKKLIDIVQRGRASGIIILAATQCPDHTQISTSFRRQIDGKICGRLRVQGDLDIVGIKTNDKIEEYRTGEFIINAKGFNNVKLQGLYIDEKKNKNKVYDGLKEALIDDDNKNTDKNTSLNKGANMGINEGHNVTYSKNVIMPSSAAIKLTEKFKNIANEHQNKSKSEGKNEKGITKNVFLYMLMVFILCENFQDGQTTPSLEEMKILVANCEFATDEELTPKKYRTTKEKLYQNDLLWKSSPKSTKYRINYKKLKNELNNLNKQFE